MTVQPAFAHRLRASDGFTLVEAVMALFVAVVLFSVLGTLFVATTLQTREARHQEEATQLSIEGIEVVRALPWAELAMVSVESGDPRVAGGWLRATPAELPANEALVVDGTNGSVVAKFTVTIDDFDYQVWSYVTEVQPELRRAVVFVTWEGGSSTRSHHTSSMISELRAG